jgi:hypothetical protein
MTRFVTVIFALLLTVSGISAAPVSRIDSHRDSCSIVWIAEQDVEQTVAAAAPSRSTARLSEYRSRAFGFYSDFTLFQRPPPPIR